MYKIVLKNNVSFAISFFLHPNGMKINQLIILISSLHHLSTNIISFPHQLCFYAQSKGINGIKNRFAFSRFIFIIVLVYSNATVCVSRRPIRWLNQDQNDSEIIRVAFLQLTAMEGWFSHFHIFCFWGWKRSHSALLSTAINISFKKRFSN